MAKFIGKYTNRNGYDTDEKQYPNVSYLQEEDTIVWQKEAPSHDYSQDYLTFVALEDGTFNAYKQHNDGQIYYSVDNGSTWIPIASAANTPTITAGSKILWKGVGLTIGNGVCDFHSTGRFNAEGNPLSMYYGDDFEGVTDLTGKDNILQQLFVRNENIVNAENLSLPATTLSDSCYQQMFYGCSSLVTAPELPATTLGTMSYCYMFSNCTSLTTAPELPAQTIGIWSYMAMFGGCRSLNYIKCLVTNFDEDDTMGWVKNVASTGTFVKAAGAEWTTGNNGIPSGWTVEEV